MTDEVAGRRDVVVGVDGSAGSSAAVRYAIDEARRSGGEVRAVHVVPDLATYGYPVPAVELVETARSLLGAVRERAGETVPEVGVRTRLRHGSRGAALVSEARGAGLLVVGADRRPVLERLTTGNTSTRVAATSAAPVVVVPEGWTPTGHGIVLAALKRTDRTTDVLAEAFDLAEARGSRLRVLHAWHLSAEYDTVLGTEVVAEWTARARAELEDVVGRWRSTYPSVPVEVVVVHAQPARALVAASDDVDELVLVRRAHGVPAALHLGSTARTVLREARCPVRVVVPGHADVVTDLVLEEAGAARA